MKYSIGCSGKIEQLFEFDVQLWLCSVGQSLES